jgi:hypothetical protein
MEQIKLSNFKAYPNSKTLNYIYVSNIWDEFTILTINTRDFSPRLNLVPELDNLLPLYFSSVFVKSLTSKNPFTIW